MKKTDESMAALLRAHGQRATPGRVAILEVLQKSPVPLSATKISNGLKEKLDKVTVYRALEKLTATGLVGIMDFKHSHAHYEILAGRDHHHHLVCQTCGKVEDVATCFSDVLEKTALRKTRGFASVKEHSLEFFGLCKKCA